MDLPKKKKWLFRDIETKTIYRNILNTGPYTMGSILLGHTQWVV